VHSAGYQGWDKSDPISTYAAVKGGRWGAAKNEVTLVVHGLIIILLLPAITGVKKVRN
jgi:hypothetical protein